MKKKLLLLCATITCSFIFVFAGNNARVIIPNNPAKKFYKIPENLKDGEDYLSKTIIFKVKPQYRQNCRVNSIDNLFAINDFMNFIGEQNLAKIYPNHEAPVHERNSMEQQMVDLSLIYSFKYTADVALNKVINQLLSLGYVEYAEPWYIPKIHLNPSDTGWVSQYHLRGNVPGSINATDAWTMYTGSASIVIGITDTGFQLNHPDLQADIKYNTADGPAVNGIDDDGDGYIDNYYGWDVGMNDRDPTWQGNAHGVATSGDACAATNNVTGVASPGFNTKFLPVKVANASGSLIAAYQGIIYAADHGCNIISCSWGTPGGGDYEQSIIDYAVINKNVAVFASAGNGGINQQVYPSSSNNVYRVASSTNDDSRSNFSDHGNDVDWSAPGDGIYSTWANSSYTALSGTSMACPVSAGAAGLIQAYFNYTYTNCLQAAEKLKQTCNILTGNNNNTQLLYSQGKLGKGRINMYNALTQAAKSVIMNPITVTDNNDNIFLPGETLYFSGVFTNYLDAISSNCIATLTVASVSSGTLPALVDSSTIIGALATLGTRNNNVDPFRITIASNAPINQNLKFKITITDGTYSSSQYFDIIVNVDFVNVTVNDVFTTITSRGRTGYNLFGQMQGIGFQYQLPTAENLLYEMSLMIGTSPTKVSDMFRESSTANNDFKTLSRVCRNNPAVVSDFDVEGKFNDSSSTSIIPVEVHHSAYAWSTVPYRKFILVKYKIKNTNNSTLDTLYAGIIADWDITNAWQNKGAYDAANKMGYVWHTAAGGKYAAIKLLSTGPALHYTIDNVPNGNGGVSPVDFFTAKKFTVLSTNRATDGYAAAGGGDVFDCVSTGPFTINAGDSIEVAFALIAGDNLADIQTSACAAQYKYDNNCIVSVNDIENNNFEIWHYPNPASDFITIRYNVPKNNNTSLAIMNSVGQVVMTAEKLVWDIHEKTFDVSKISSGMYYYQLKDGESTITKKFAIVR
ncbi:MAG: S8/S53 family peptidase [Bacteroidota bacterium]